MRVHAHLLCWYCRTRRNAPIVAPEGVEEQHTFEGGQAGEGGEGCLGEEGGGWDAKQRV
jgi:hypothetical protein